jgi:hypothetical protein
MMKNEKVQLTTKLANIEQENSVRIQQLLSEQARIKELQLNIQMLDDHNSIKKSTIVLFFYKHSFILDSIKRDSANEEKKYEQEKSTLINKFERTKQQWTEIFKPQYVNFSIFNV